MTDVDPTAYAYQLMDEVLAESEVSGADLGESFTTLILEQFAADGHVEEPHPVRYKAPGVEVSGWSASSDGRVLDLFLTDYSPRADEEHKVGKAEVTAAFKRMGGFLSLCVTDDLPARHRGSELAGTCAEVSSRFGYVERVRLVYITNARSVARGTLAPTRYEGRQISRELWDLQRLANWAASGSRAEPLIADFPDGLAYLRTPTTREDHTVLLAVVPGRDLADLYSAHGPRLLELNVRSFLQVRGGVNKGILETLRSNPQRFLAYNNGLAATGSHVEFGTRANGEPVILSIRDFQIVNGGQTTATIHHAHRNRVDIGEVLVQMKLTLVPPDHIDDIVPQISAFSNSQNKVTASDLRANSGFHVDVERIMRTLWAPATAAQPHDTHWFYERARGQYANAVARESTRARQRIFRLTNPATQKFSKADLAKFEHSWSMLPHLVSLGAEKNFVLFSERVDAEPVTVDKEYCRRLVAKAILFRRTDKIVAAQDFGGYKANIVTYTVAKLVHATRGRIDLDRIWRIQDLSPALRDAIAELSRLVQKVITSPPPGRSHVGEWTKRPECWGAVRAIEWRPPPDLTAELTGDSDYSHDLDIVRATTAADWRDLADWGSRDGLLSADQLRAVEAVAEALENGWSPAGRHLHAGVDLMRQARLHGFRTPTDV